MHVLSVKLDVAADRKPRQAVFRFANLLADELGGKPDGESLHPDSDVPGREVVPHLVNEDEKPKHQEEGSNRGHGRSGNGLWQGFTGEVSVHQNRGLFPTPSIGAQGIVQGFGSGWQFWMGLLRFPKL